MDYMTAQPSPLAKPTSYDPTIIGKLLKALQRYDLAKAELLMILNLRPQSEAVLHSILEEFDDRFNEDTRAEILQTIQDVLGKDDPDEMESTVEQERSNGSTQDTLKSNGSRGG